MGELVATVNALVVLVPLTEETERLVDAALLSRLPDGVVVVNAARRRVVDTEALAVEVGGGKLLAVLDVTDSEPLPRDHPLWTAEGCFVSPHLAGATAPCGRVRGGGAGAVRTRTVMKVTKALNVEDMRELAHRRLPRPVFDLVERWRRGRGHAAPESRGLSIDATVVEHISPLGL